ncbi:MAG TPA: acyl--CoA ligase family protein [Candidatus Eremiobacteraceae bacterium]|nr:acyl--CoA ligase family protein [Candidatus Eremiobacteraceae bacterium]
MIELDRPTFQKLWSRDQWAGLPVNKSLLSPLSFIERSVHVYGDKTAMVDGSRRLTYEQLGARTYRLASALRATGIEKGDRVALLAYNSDEALEAHFGVPQIGAVLVAINIRLSADEIGYILAHCGAKAIIAHPDFAHLIAPGLAASDLEHTIWVGHEPDGAAEFARPRTDGRTNSTATYEDFIASGSPEPFNLAIADEEDPISINYTSGTTGRPKGVMYTHRGAYLNALGEVYHSGLTGDSVYLWTLPMFHCNGWCYTWGVTAAGATHIALPRVEPKAIFDLIERERVTHLCGAPTVLVMIANEAPTKDYRFPRPLRILTAGAPPPPTVIARIESMGAVLTHAYGLTETYGPHTVSEWQIKWNDKTPEERSRLKARQGVGFIHAPELRVVDDEMHDVPADGTTMGEVVMRGNNVMKGYFNDPAATEKAFRGGWFHSGDLGVMHPDGYIELRDRAKDIIISGGENISTIEVERVVYAHPAVLEAAVIGVPDEKWGEVPKAFVTLKPGATASAQDIIAFCRDKIAHFKAPKTVEFGPLPKTSTGKVQKFKLRDQEWAGREKRIN